MHEQPEPGLSEEEFEAELRELVGDKSVKLWLARSNGARFDVVFSIGVAQGEPIHMFDHMEGFYLFGEGVSPDLLPGMHDLFARYCRTHRAVPFHHPDQALVMRYRSFGHGRHRPHRVSLHYPTPTL
jgi:hypothetical protein